MCAGATVWNAIDKSGVRGSGRIGIVGVGGLGHLAIQYISKMGIQAIAFSGTESKKQQALDFGASEFHLTRGVTKLDGVEKLDALLITSSFNPDLSL
jgi:D-arabinose 1-dehydrogenase-like Zn-dependent alcohol dehydrogenase